MRELVQMFEEKFSVKEVKFIKSPLYICPLGAHTDHQNGLVTGMALNISINLAYSPNNEGYIRVQSTDFPDEEYFHMDNVPGMLPGYWGNYLRGAVLSLSKKYKLNKGINGVIRGKSPIACLNSTAAVITAYLMALCDVNNLSLSKEELIEHSHWVEKDFIGLDKGILEQAANILSKNNHIMMMDCKTGNYRLIKQPPQMPNFEIIIVYSGIDSSPINAEYKNRIDECRVVAWLLQELEQNRRPAFKEAKLRDIEENVFAEHMEYIPGSFRRRALHYFSEIKRVEKGVQAWANGDLKSFGRLMFESGRSSINNYGCECPELKTIFNILTECPGVYGARISGTAYKGSCIGIVNPKYKFKIKDKIDKEYPKMHPEYKNRYRVHFCGTDDGARIVSMNEIAGRERRLII